MSTTLGAVGGIQLSRHASAFGTPFQVTMITGGDHRQLSVEELERLGVLFFAQALAARIVGAAEGEDGS